MAEIRILSEDSIQALRRDHERLRYELMATRARLRAYMAAAGDRGMKPACTFALSTALSASDAAGSAVIIDQYGAGRDHMDTSITVLNPLAGTARMFYGVAGTVGEALWDPARNGWLIIQLHRACPEQ
ncbi:MAG: hypothetical protein GXY58_19375 [Planctomycetaceae bacterium]|nr:hypothetical protein [Planctomycetaceae bacterium]